MKTRPITSADARDERRGASHAQSVMQARAAAMPDTRAASLAQLHQQNMAGNSSQAAQLKAQAELMAGSGNDASIQRIEDEELLQGKFAVAQREEEEEELLQGKFAPAAAPIQREEAPNDTGMSSQLKSGIESLSGMSMDHVKVHYNSDKPAQLNAHAYAQGSDIHVAPGQEQHVPHEAWHVVQQAQGRVRPTMQMQGGVDVNNDVGLESEADVMGAQALQVAQAVVDKEH